MRFLSIILFPIITITFLTTNIFAQETDYEFIRTDSPITWFQATDSAKALGGQLAVISNMDEQATILALLSPNDTAWLGGTDYVIEQNWVWTNGESWDYTNWEVDQPDPDTSSLFDYLMITPDNNGRWLTGDLAAPGFVVEYGCCQVATTGNVNCDPDGNINILDIVMLIDYIYGTQEPLCCLDAANADGDPDRNLGLTDVIALIDYLYKSKTLPAPCPSLDIIPSDTILIVDVEGKAWDVTHAVYFHGFDTTKFYFGNGQYFFDPIMFPDFLSPGDPDYPASNETFQVMGMFLDGEVRSYPVHMLHGIEVCNDTLAGQHIAVTY